MDAQHRVHGGDAAGDELARSRNRRELGTGSERLGLCLNVPPAAMEKLWEQRQAASISSRDDESAIRFVHIPKVGGSAVDFEIKEALAPLKLKYFTRQACFEDMAGGFRGKLIVWLREPASHVRSNYEFCTKSAWGQHAVNKTLGISNHGAIPNASDGYELWLRHFVSLSGAQVGPQHDFNCADPRDMMTRHLSCAGCTPDPLQKSSTPANHALPRQHPPSLLRALANLRRADFVGIMEEMDLSICMLRRRLSSLSLNGTGAAHPVACTKFHAHRINANPHSTTTNEIADELVANLTSLDAQIYSEGLRIFRQQAGSIALRSPTEFLGT